MKFCRNAVLVFTILLIILCILLNCVQQSSKATWKKIYRKKAHAPRSVIQTSNGEYIVIGTVFAKSDSIFMTKINSQGEKLWTKKFRNLKSNNVSSVQETSDGGYIIAGSTGPEWNSNVRYIYLLLTDQNGELQWEKTIGGEYQSFATSVQQTLNGEYLLSGTINKHNINEFDFFLMLTDCEGKKLWLHTYGGPRDDAGHYACQTNDGGYIMVGKTQSSTRGFNDILIIKTDEKGEVLWTRKLKEASISESGQAIQLTENGGFIIIGNTQSSGPEFDVYLIRLDINGNILWTKTYGDDKWNIGISIKQTDDGGYAVLAQNLSYGRNIEEIWLLRTDSKGDTLWTKTYEGYPYEFQITADKGYIMVAKNSLTDFQETYLIKTDSLGRVD